MKTQVCKNSETVKSSNSMMVLSMIICSGILLFATENIHLFSKSSSLISMAKHGNEMLLTEINPSENQAGMENKILKNPSSEIEFSMVKMQEYLIPEIEQEIDVSFANSILFPDVELPFSAVENGAHNDYFLNELEAQSKKKTQEVIEYYEFEKKISEFLVIETEKPLLLENWMADEDLLRKSSRETTVFAKEK